MRAFRFDGDRLFESAAFDGVLLKRGRGGELSSQASAMPFLLPEDAVLIADASLDSTLALTEATAGDPLIEGAALEKQPPLSNVRLHLFEPDHQRHGNDQALWAHGRPRPRRPDRRWCATGGRAEPGGTADDSVSVEVSAGKQYIRARQRTGDIRLRSVGRPGVIFQPHPPCLCNVVSRVREIATKVTCLRGRSEPGQKGEHPFLRQRGGGRVVVGQRRVGEIVPGPRIAEQLEVEPGPRIPSAQSAR